MKRPLEKTRYKVTLGPKEDGIIGIQETIVEKFKVPGFDIEQENLKREKEIKERFGPTKVEMIFEDDETQNKIVTLEEFSKFVCENTDIAKIIVKEKYMITRTYFTNVEIAKAIKPESNLALISISPLDNPIVLPFEKEWGERLLLLNFYDIDRYVEDQFGLFDNKHAKKIIEFLERINKSDQEMTVIINCISGVSRSSAVSKFIDYKYDLNRFDPEYEKYNKYVYKVLIETNLGCEK